MSQNFQILLLFHYSYPLLSTLCSQLLYFFWFVVIDSNAVSLFHVYYAMYWLEYFYFNLCYNSFLQSSSCVAILFNKLCT